MSRILKIPPTVAVRNILEAVLSMLGCRIVALRLLAQQRWTVLLCLDLLDHATDRLDLRRRLPALDPSRRLDNHSIGKTFDVCRETQLGARILKGRY